MELKKADDPRNPLERMRRTELAYLARLENRDDIDSAMPAPVMRKRFRERPPSRMPRPLFDFLGARGVFRLPPYEEWIHIAFGEAPKVEQAAVEMDADALLEAEWAAKTPDYSAMTMPQLRRAAKEMGLKQTPKDTKASLIARLERGQDAS